MIPHKIDIETFYEKLRDMFPTLNELPVWTEWDCNNDGYAHSIVMSRLATELINLATKGNWSDAKRFLDKVEEGFVNGDIKVVAFLGTDFTVTILECGDVPVREKIKELMGIATRNAYQMNLRGYTESN